MVGSTLATVATSDKVVVRSLLPTAHVAVAEPMILSRVLARAGVK